MQNNLKEGGKGLVKMRNVSWQYLFVVLVVCLFSGCGDTYLEVEEDLNVAWEELRAAEGKADGFVCSGVIPPDMGPFDKKIALTFDDGPRVLATSKVLEVLELHQATATFFVNGQQLDNQEDRQFIVDMAAKGHLIGNHSQSHLNSKRVSDSYWADEVEQTDEILKELLAEMETYPKYFRFPFGSANCSTYQTVVDYGYRVTGWHIDSADWCFNSSTGGYGYCSESTFRHIPDSYRDNYLDWVSYQANRYEGGILLMHDVHTFTGDNLDALLTRLEDEGFTFTTLDDMETFPLLNGETLPWVGDVCDEDSICDYSHEDESGWCFEFVDSLASDLGGFCSLSCEGYCPDSTGKAQTFCVADPNDDNKGICVPKSSNLNNDCLGLPGTQPIEAERFVGNSSAYETTAVVCLPN
jgi:peptidoglycan/xylan/chitin deacetylase (PgdA/CDA1 family)